MKLGNLLENEKTFKVDYTLDLGGLTLEKLRETYKDADLSIREQRQAMLADLFRALFVESNDRAEGVFHPSEIARESSLCVRRLYYGIAQIPKDASFIPLGGAHDNKLQRIFDLGTMLHWYIQINLLVHGYLIDFEVPTVSKKYLIKGKADGIVENVPELPKGEKAILEIKSINDNGFNYLKGPKKDHINQASIYASTIGIKYIFFVYYNKNNSEIKYYLVPVNTKFVEKFHGIALDVKNTYKTNKFKNGTDVKKHKIDGKVCQTMNSKLAMECPFAEFCFSY